MTQGIPTPYTPSTAYAVKVVVFLESGPQTDRFSQVQLTDEQMREILTVMTKFLRKTPEGASAFPLNLSHTYKFPEIQATYTAEQIGTDPSIV